VTSVLVDLWVDGSPD